jgi:hypothetical protein
MLIALLLPSCGHSSREGMRESPAAGGGGGTVDLGGATSRAGRSGETSDGGAEAAENAGSAGLADAGAPPCTDPDELEYVNQYQTPTTTTGLNGAFADQCDAADNLVEYRCEGNRAPGLNCEQPHPDPRCFDFMPTGQVIAVTLDCGGTCSDGACTLHCPETGDEITYVAIDHESGAATLANSARDAEYSCDLGKDWQQGGYDCIADPNVGDSMTATYHYSMTPFCVVGESFSVQLGTTALTECQYECTHTR